MKICLPLLALYLPTGLQAEVDKIRQPQATDVEENMPQDPLIVRALGRLAERLGVRFNIPFPADFDCDAHRKQPLAVMTVDGSKICLTRPMVNPFDEPRTVEWMMGPANPAKLGHESIDCAFILDDRGEFSRLNLIADWATDGTGTHQLDRGEGETGRELFERARLTYRDRAAKAKDPAAAQLYLTAFEKIAAAIQILRKEEPNKTPEPVK